MYFTDKEQSAIHRLLAMMAGADEKLHDDEKSLGAIIAHKLGSTPEIILNSSTMDLDEVLNIVTAMSTEEKRFVCGLLGTMMVIDDEVSPRERLFWALISTRCGFSNMNVVEAKEIVADFLGI